MKNAEQVKSEISILEAEFSKMSDSKERRAASKRVATLRAVLAFLQCEPTEEFVGSSLEKTRQILRSYRNAYQNTAHLSTRGQIKLYRSELRLKYRPQVLKSQIGVMEYILT